MSTVADVAASGLSDQDIYEARYLIREGMKYLASLCDDFATVQNGIGFDKADTATGHEFAALDLNDYNDEITSWGYQRCHKYRKQLDGLAPNYFDRIPRVEQVRTKGDPWWKQRRAEKKEEERRVEAARKEEERAERLKGRISLDPQGRATYSYPYDPARNDLVRQLGARWDPVARCWSGPITAQNADGIMALERRDFIISAKVRDACIAAKANPVAAAPTRTATLSGHGIVRFRYPRDQAVNDAVKALGARWHKEESDWDWSVWGTRLTPQNAAGILALGRLGFQIDDKIAQAGAALTAEARATADKAARNLAGSTATDAAIEIPGFTGNLYPFQRAGIAYMVRERRVLNADQPGLGKTRQAIGAVQKLGAYPTVVVAPSSVKYNWEREWHACAPGHSIKVISGTTPLPLRDYRADVVILNYDILSAHALLLKTDLGLKSAIVDESHYIKNAKAARTQLVTELVSGLDTRFFLTGTPVLNKPVELLSQLTALGRIGDVMGERDQKRAEWAFLQRHCDAWDEHIGRKRIWHFDGASKLDVLNANMRKACYVRREKAEVLKELPPKRRVVVEVDITNRAEYARQEREFLGMVAEQAVRDTAFQATLVGKSAAEQQQMIAARRDGADRAKYLMKITAMKKLIAKGKQQVIKAWAQDFFESGEKLVMFGWHRDTVQMLAKTFDAPTIMGGDSALARQASVDDFQTNPETRAIACNIIAAGEGITLTAASNTLFAELGWNPGKHEQAEDRTHRIGQESDSVTSWYLIAKGTLEEKLYRLIFSEKMRVVRGANDGIWGERDDDPGDLLDQLILDMRSGK